MKRLLAYLFIILGLGLVTNNIAKAAEQYCINEIFVHPYKGSYCNMKKWRGHKLLKIDQIAYEEMKEFENKYRKKKS